MQLEERRKEQAHARHVGAGNTLVAIVDEKEDGAVESEAVEEFGGGTQGGGVGLRGPPPLSASHLARLFMSSTSMS